MCLSRHRQVEYELEEHIQHQRHGDSNYQGRAPFSVEQHYTDEQEEKRRNHKSYQRHQNQNIQQGQDDDDQQPFAFLAQMKQAAQGIVRFLLSHIFSVSHICNKGIYEPQDAAY
ncbi:hypothetical protein SDC9_176219 [bioreactor metagenome]|uniref:Uncharacterized protein n=1 Tax=bioreactor metagenome TaxID=1076179 RepID=A0A645GXL8_9ZZZZ